MKATDALKAEHRLIEWVLRTFDAGVDKLLTGEKPHPVKSQAMIDFFRDFINGCHLPKEEQVLFTAMKAYGVPIENGPIGLLLEEHETGRQMVQRLQSALDRLRSGDEAARGDWIETARSYSALLAGHILKEDQILFPISERVIPSSAQRQIWEAFESEPYARSGHERCEDFLQRAFTLTDTENLSG